jgi:hypothetical protein
MTGPSLGSDHRLHAGLVVMFSTLVYNISLLVVLTLNFFLFEPKIVLVLRLTRLSSSRRFMSIGFTSADLASQMSSCLCQDYNILLLFKRDILYTGNVEYILLCLCLKQKIIKIKQAFTNIQQPRASRYFFWEIFKFQWKSGARATNFPAVCADRNFSWSCDFSSGTNWKSQREIPLLA